MKKTINVQATLDNLDTVIGFVEENLVAFECPTKIAMKIVVCVEELYVNIASYAYEGNEGNCTLTVENDGIAKNKVKITLVDGGIPFNPIEKENPDTNLDAVDREIGGLGIFMVKNIMDNIYYERKEENNIIIMEKSW